MRRVQVWSSQSKTMQEKRAVCARTGAHPMNDAAYPATGGQLARNSINTTHIVFFVVAAAAPLASVVGASPAAFAFGNGAGVPGVFLLVGLLYLTFSVGFTAMSRFAGSAGGFYTYIAKGLGRPAGVAAASVAILTYKAIQLAVYSLFGVFVSGALAKLDVTVPWWAAIVALMAVVGLCGARSIAFSSKLLGLCMLAEVAILAFLDIGISCAAAVRRESASPPSPPRPSSFPISAPPSSSSSARS